MQNLKLRIIEILVFCISNIALSVFPRGPLFKSFEASGAFFADNYHHDFSSKCSRQAFRFDQEI